MASSMSTRTPAGPRGPVGLGLPTPACAVDPAVLASRRAWPTLAVAARPRPGTPAPGVLGTGVFGIGVFGTPAFDARGKSGNAQRVGKRTATEHNGTTLGIPSPRSPSS